MSRSEEPSFELPSLPPTFGVVDESPELKDVIKPTPIPKKPELLPNPDATNSKKPEKKPAPKKLITPPRARLGAPPSVPKPLSAPAIPVVVVAPERTKSPEMEKAEVFSEYFKSVKTHERFLEEIVNMPRDRKLRQVMEVSELETFSGELYDKMFGFFLEFEARKEGESSSNLVKFAGTFISKEKIPAGCQGALRAIVHADVVKKLRESLAQPSTENSPVASEPVSAESGGKKPLTRAETLIADLAKAKAEKATKGVEASKEGEEESAWERTERMFGSLFRAKGAEAPSPTSTSLISPEVVRTPAPQPPLLKETISPAPEASVKASGTKESQPEEKYSGKFDTITDLADLDTASIQLIWDRVNDATFQTALVDLHESFRTPILEGLLATHRATFASEIARMEKAHNDSILTDAEIDAARKEVVRVVRILEEYGSLSYRQVLAEGVSGAETTRKVEHKENLSTAEQIGQAFVRFCKEDGPVFDEEELRIRLRSVSGAEVRTVYKKTSSQEDYFLEKDALDKDPGSALRYFLVAVGSENYLLPKPNSSERFDSILALPGPRLGRPDQLISFLPPELVLNGRRWELKDKESSGAGKVESSKIASLWTPEKIEAMTFEEIGGLNDADLERILIVGDAYEWGVASQGMSKAFLDKVHSIYTVQAGVSFNAGLLHVGTDSMTTDTRRDLIERVKNSLRKK